MIADTDARHYQENVFRPWVSNYLLHKHLSLSFIISTSCSLLHKIYTDTSTASDVYRETFREGWLKGFHDYRKGPYYNLAALLTLALDEQCKGNVIPFKKEYSHTMTLDMYSVKIWCNTSENGKESKVTAWNLALILKLFAAENYNFFHVVLQIRRKMFVMWYTLIAYSLIFHCITCTAAGD